MKHCLVFNYCPPIVALIALSGTKQQVILIHLSQVLTTGKNVVLNGWVIRVTACSDPKIKHGDFLLSICCFDLSI